MAYTAKEDLQYAADVNALSQQNTYIPSANVAGAQAELQQVSAGKPAEYTNENAEQLGGLYDKIINREAFSYDPSKDSAYQDYRSKYMAAGQQAAKDSIRTNRAMAGGYGDVWTKAAANQQYGEYLKGIDDALPQFEQNAYGRYQAEGNLLNTQLGAAQAQDETAYGRWQDQYNNWQADRNFAADRAQTEFQKDYRMYSDNMQNAMTMIGYGREDAATVAQNAYSMATALLQQGVMPIDSLLAQAGIDRKMAMKLAVKNGYTEPGSGGHGGSGKRKSGSGAGTTGVTTDASSTNGLEIAGQNSGKAGVVNTVTSFLSSGSKKNHMRKGVSNGNK